MLSESSPNASRFCRNALSDKLADGFTGGTLSLVENNNVDGGREAFERARKMHVLVASILALTALFREPLSEQGSPRNTVSEQLVVAPVGLARPLRVRWPTSRASFGSA